METTDKFALISNEIEEIFILKNKDYGMSWFVFRPMTFADQILMKILRIKNDQDGGVLQINENVKNDWIAVANYSVLAIIKKESKEVKIGNVESLYKEKHKK